MTPAADTARVALAVLVVRAGVQHFLDHEAAGRNVLLALGGPKIGSDLDDALKAFVRGYAAGVGVRFGEVRDGTDLPRLLLTNNRALVVGTAGGRADAESVPYPAAVRAAVELVGGTGEDERYKRSGRRNRGRGAA